MWVRMTWVPFFLWIKSISWAKIVLDTALGLTEAVGSSLRSFAYTEQNRNSKNKIKANSRHSNFLTDLPLENINTCLGWTDLDSPFCSLTGYFWYFSDLKLESWLFKFERIFQRNQVTDRALSNKKKGETTRSRFAFPTTSGCLEIHPV